MRKLFALVAMILATPVFAQELGPLGTSSTRMEGNWRSNPVGRNQTGSGLVMCRIDGVFFPHDSNRLHLEVAKAFRLSVILTTRTLRDDYVLFRLRSQHFDFPFDQRPYTLEGRRMVVDVAGGPGHFVPIIVSAPDEISFPLERDPAEELLTSFQDGWPLHVRNSPAGELTFWRVYRDLAAERALPTISDLFACASSLSPS